MTTPGPARRAALFALAASFGWASGPGGPVPPAWAQSPQPAAAGSPLPQATLSQAQLEQLLAPIALYPDSLLVQVLMASTYPLEVVQAKRWLGQGNRAQLKGEALAKALEAEAWDPSVKSLAPFPDVLTMMNEQLDWTQDLGDAVLAQQDDVFNAVQVLRGRAKAAGKLETGPQQIVSVSQPATMPSSGTVAVVSPPPEVITIAPADPSVVYVPSYNPSVVYGSWPYPSAPPYYYPPPPAYGVGSALLTGMAFAGGVALAGSLWGWASPNWGGGSVNVNASRYNTINAGRSQINNSNWSHDVSHRQGVAYRD
jgi:hypothetical protein